MSEETLTVRVPLAVRKRGGRKVVLAPDLATALPTRDPANWTLVKNLARAFRWQRMLESGEYATIAELAKAQGANDSYLSRTLRLTLMAPKQVEAILEGSASNDSRLGSNVRFAPAAVMARGAEVDWLLDRANSPTRGSALNGRPAGHRPRGRNAGVSR